MILMHLSRILIISILFFNMLFDKPKDKSLFISPVKIPLLLSANFGELRIDHFHSGLDIKTQGVTGKEVEAAASGYIYRISVSPGGFGKALYIRHPSGYSTVYGHLDKFTQEIEDYVKAQQYEKKSFLITLYPDRERFVLKQGDLIGYSGNSGSSGGPHLHFEIRKSDSELPVNPLLFDFGPEDNIEPVIEKLVIYPVNNHTLINDQNLPKKLNVTGGHGKYYIAPENEIRISGLAGFGIKSFDLLNDSNNKCAVYSIELVIDSATFFNYVMDGFSFNESRYINSHIDYETYIKQNIYIERTYILPNDKLSVYKNSYDNGIFNFNDNRRHNVKIIVTDVHNNKSSLSFHINAESAKSEIVTGTLEKNITVMPYNRENKFTSENIMIDFPEGALYDTLNFSYKQSKGTRDMFSDIHYVHNNYTPLHKAIKLSIKPNNIPPGKKSKMMIVLLGDDLKKSALNSTWNEEYLTTEAYALGRYYIGIDSVAPEIVAYSLVPGANLTGKKEIRMKISDDFSGIKSYEPTIDGKWALFEYDQKNDLLVYKLDEHRITRETKHSLSLKVTDNKNNTSYYNCNFIW